MFLFLLTFRKILLQNFDGVGVYNLTLVEVKKLLGWDGTSEYKIQVTGSVTDGQTKVTINETAEIDIKSTNIKVEALYKPNTIKPGLFYTAYVCYCFIYIPYALLTFPLFYPD